MSANKDQNLCKMRVKAVLLGESGVGKTSIIRQFVNHSFDPNVSSSISSTFSSRMLDISNTKQSINFDVWDTAGQEKYRSLAKIFYKDAKIIIFVYDVTNQNTFENIKEFWYKEIMTNCEPNIILGVAGNKIDLYGKEKVNENEAKQWAKSINAVFSSTSAKSNIGIDLLFDEIGKKCLDHEYKFGEKDKTAQNNYYKNKHKNKHKNSEEDDDNNMNVDVPIKLVKKENINKGKKCC